jgi:hypothetical protein
MMRSDQTLYRATRAAKHLVCICAAAVTLAAPVAMAENSNEPPRGRGGPPPEALAACKSLVADDACTFTAKDETLQGTCWAPEDKPLACRPDNAPAQNGDQSKRAH